MVVRYTRLLFVLGSLTIGLPIAGCRDGDNRGPGLAGPVRPKISAMYCNAGAARCGEVQSAINYLRSSADAICNDMGWLAQERFDAQAYGFEGDDTTTAYGYMYPGNPNTWLGNNTTFGNNELANTVAHEESHHSGYDHPASDDIGDRCGAGYDSATDYPVQLIPF